MRIAAVTAASALRTTSDRGPEGGSLGEQDQRLELGPEVEVRLRLDEVVDEAHREPPGGPPDALLSVRVHDVVAAGLAGAARLAAAHLGAGLALQLQRDVLGHVPGPRPAAQPPLEAARAAGAAGVLPDAGEHLEQRVVEAGEPVRWELLEDAKVDDQLDRRVVAPVVGPAVDARLDDAQLGPRHQAGRDLRPRHGAAA